MRRALVAALVALAGTSAWADEITLRTGTKIVGIAREEAGRIIVEMNLGTVTFAKEDVVSVTPGRTALHDYNDKAAAIKDSKSAKDYVDLARWARQNGVSRHVKSNLDQALALDANNEWARRELGYTLHKGKWMTQDEVMRDQGFVSFEGRWMTLLEKELIVKRRLEAESSRQAAEAQKRVRKDAERIARDQAMQEYWDDVAERDRMRRTAVQGYGDWRHGWGYRPYGGRYYGWYGDATAVFDVYGLLRDRGHFGGAKPTPSLPKFDK